MDYLIKFSIVLSLTWVIYRFFLRGLTFYKWNRYYLLGYSLLCFILPLIDIGPWINNDTIEHVAWMNIIPEVNNYVYDRTSEQSSDSLLSIVTWMFIAGAAVCVFRIVVQYYSFRKIRKRAVLLEKIDGVSIYSSDFSGSFSLGNDIYLDPSARSQEELERILVHELVHVKQQHTVDLVIGELLCIINWFNPVAWWMRRAIRQNLEFIADKHVLDKGYDQKDYQYLLLRVTGISDYRMATHFNITDLKNRIIMMNKMKSAKVHLVKFLFMLPLLAVLLVAFRRVSENTGQPMIYREEVTFNHNRFIDTIPPTANNNKSSNKRYDVRVINSQGEDFVLIRESGSNTLLTMTMKDWNKNRKQNEEKYGKIVYPTVPPVPPVAPVPPAPPVPEVPVGPVPPEPPKKS